MNKTKREDFDKTKFKRMRFLLKRSRLIKTNKDLKNDIKKVFCLNILIFQSTFN